MIRRRVFAVMIATAALSGAVQIGAVQAVRADPTGHSVTASCMGYEASSISPPGSSDEEIGGAPQFVAEVKELAAGLGAPPGALFAFIAGLHEGSHEDCDEALGG
jgi:hypothetical protein